MKKILKICLTLAVSLFLIGLIIIAVSFAFGGQGLIEDLVQGKGNINLGNNPKKQLVCTQPVCFVTGAPLNGNNINVKA